MITLDQIKQLDHKVHKAVDKISSLKNDNIMLQEKLDKYQLRIEELEVLINTFKEDQGEIEKGIIDALNQLDLLEDSIALSEVDSDLKLESSDQPSEDSEIKGETTVVIEEYTNTEKDDDSNEEESESEVSSENNESELDIF